MLKCYLKTNFQAQIKANIYYAKEKKRQLQQRPT